MACMVFEKLIRYIGLAVGLKPSATGCEARLRGLERMMYSKTMRSPPARARNVNAYRSVELWTGVEQRSNCHGRFWTRPIRSATSDTAKPAHP